MLCVVKRSFTVPSLKRVRWALYGLANVPVIAGQFVPTRIIVVRNHLLTRTGGRKAALRIGILKAAQINRNVLLYRKPQPAYHLTYPVFTPFKRRVKALGQQVAPVPSVGGGGTGMDLTHGLGLSLIKLGGMKF